MVDILKLAQEAPEYEGSNWVHYREAYFLLIGKKYTPQAAVNFIAEKAGISDEDAKKFRSSASHWKKPTKGKDSK